MFGTKEETRAQFVNFSFGCNEIQDRLEIIRKLSTEGNMASHSYLSERALLSISMVCDCFDEIIKISGGTED